VVSTIGQKRIVRAALDIAIENHLPRRSSSATSAGGFSPRCKAEFFPRTAIFAGRIFPQPVHPVEDGAYLRSRWVMGHCTAGGAYIPRAQ